MAVAVFLPACPPRLPSPEDRKLTQSWFLGSFLVSWLSLKHYMDLATYKLSWKQREIILSFLRLWEQSCPLWPTQVPPSWNPSPTACSINLQVPQLGGGTSSQPPAGTRALLLAGLPSCSRHLAGHPTWPPGFRVYLPTAGLPQAAENGRRCLASPPGRQSPPMVGGALFTLAATSDP